MRRRASNQFQEVQVPPNINTFSFAESGLRAKGEQVQINSIIYSFWCSRFLS
jgi:hypothetical protein